MISSARKPKTKRTLEFKLDAYRYYQDGLSAKDALLAACKDHKTTPSGCMTDYASSYMSDDIKKFLLKRFFNGGPVERYFTLHGLTFYAPSRRK